MLYGSKARFEALSKARSLGAKDLSAPSLPQGLDQLDCMATRWKTGYGVVVCSFVHHSRYLDTCSVCVRNTIKRIEPFASFSGYAPLRNREHHIGGKFEWGTQRGTPGNENQNDDRRSNGKDTLPIWVPAMVEVRLCRMLTRSLNTLYYKRSQFAGHRGPPMLVANISKLCLHMFLPKKWPCRWEANRKGHTIWNTRVTTINPWTTRRLTGEGQGFETTTHIGLSSAKKSRSYRSWGS